MLRNTVIDLIKSRGHVIVCKLCLHIADYNELDLVNGAIIGSPQITVNI